MLEQLLNEYADLKEYDCRISVSDLKIRHDRISEIMKEITALIQKETIEEVLKLGVNSPDIVKEKNKHLDSTSQEQLYSKALGYWDCLDDIKNLAKAKGIILE